jgi:hypothetical protein
MRPGRTTVIAVTAGLGLLVAGCGNSQQSAGSTSSNTATPTSASTGAVDQNKVGFMDDVCGAVGKFLVPAMSFKPDTGSQAAVVNSLKTQLTAMSSGLTAAGNDLQNMDTSKVPDGQAVVADLRKAFAQIKDTVDRTKAKLDAVDPNDQQAVAAVVQDVSKDLSGLGSMHNPLDQPNLKSADLEAAAAQAPKCQQIKDSITAGISGSAGPPSS